MTRSLLALGAGGFLLFTLVHGLALPLHVTYDGHQYLHHASLFGSEAFRSEWNALRTPGFPLALAVSFSLFGRSALAAAAVPLLLGALGSLLLADAVRRIAGDGAALVTLALLAFYPTLVAYQHTVLTETGTYFLLALVVWLLTRDPAGARGYWARAAALGLALGGAYLWRQTLLAVVPVAALLQAWATYQAAPPRRRLARAALQGALVVLVPVATHLAWWSAFPLTTLSGQLMQTYALRQGSVPPEDPLVAPIADRYRAALAAARASGSHAGIDWTTAAELFPRVTAPPTPIEGARQSVERMARYPGRYLAGLGRTLLLFAGVDGGRDENASMTYAVLLSATRGTVFAPGPATIEDRNRRDFERRIEPGGLRLAIAVLRTGYQAAVTAGVLAMALLLVVAGCRRDLVVLALAAVPAAFVLAHAVLLISLDRLVFPVYPLALACGVTAIVTARRSARGVPSTRFSQRRVSKVGG